MVSNKLRIKCTEQQHQEWMLNASLTQKKKGNNKKQIKTEKEQLKIQGFLSQQQTNWTGNWDTRCNRDPLLHESWNKKKKYKEKEKQKKIGQKKRDLPVTFGRFLVTQSPYLKTY